MSDDNFRVVGGIHRRPGVVKSLRIIIIFLAAAPKVHTYYTYYVVHVS